MVRAKDGDKLLKYLKSAGQKGIIDLDSVWEIVKMKNREKALKQHPYSIFQGKDGYWRTHLPDHGKKDGRRLIKRKNKEDLEDVLVSFYVSGDTDVAPTLRRVYPEWLHYHLLETANSATIQRSYYEWKKWFDDSKIIDVPLEKLRKIDLQEFLLRLVKENQMTKMQFYTATCQLRHIMRYCVDRGIIKENVMKDIRINPKLFKRKTKPKSETQVYTNEEAKAIVAQALAEWDRDHELGSALAVAFTFFTGVRPGEAVAFRKSDIMGSYIMVNHAAHKEYEITKDMKVIPKKEIITDQAKTYAAYREVYVTEAGRAILEKALSCAPAGEDDFYLFRDHGQRCKRTAVAYRLGKYCRILGIPYRSPNKIRKTYISRMIDSGVNINAIREQVGHERESTTYKSYCFDVNTKMETNENFENAFH